MLKQISNQIGESSNFVLLIAQVTPAPVNENLSGLTVGNSSQFNKLVQSGDVKAATQLANAVLQTIEQSDSTTTKDKIAVCKIKGSYEPTREYKTLLMKDSSANLQRF